jgi:hypothetical protein
MTNQEAIITAVQSWMTANSEVVFATMRQAIRESIKDVAEIVGYQISANSKRWLDENRTDIIAGMSLQFALNKLETDPKILDMLQKGYNEQQVSEAAAQEEVKSEGDGN